MVVRCDNKWCKYWVDGTCEGESPLLISEDGECTDYEEVEYLDEEDG